MCRTAARWGLLAKLISLLPGRRAPLITACLSLLVAATARGALTNPLAFSSLGSLEVGIGNAVSIDTTLGELRVNGILASRTNTHAGPPPPTPPPSVSINDVGVKEGKNGSPTAIFTVALSFAYSLPIPVHYKTANDPATAGIYTS